MQALKAKNKDADVQNDKPSARASVGRKLRLMEY